MLIASSTLGPHGQSLIISACDNCLELNELGYGSCLINTGPIRPVFDYQYMALKWNIIVRRVSDIQLRFTFFEKSTPDI